VSYQPGGLAGEKLVASNDKEIHKLVETVKSDVYKAFNLNANAGLIPKSYSTQVVAGTIYFVKVCIIIANNMARYLNERLSSGIY